jgi:YVTN family beta-propeller protein
MVRLRLTVTLLALCLTAPAAMAELAFVLNSKSDDMSLIDMATYQEIKRVPLGKEPHHLMPTPDDRELIIANASGNDLVIVNPETGDVLRRVARIADPYHLGFSPDRKWFVINANRLDRVDIYRYEGGDFKLAGKISLPRTTSHMAFAADSSTVYVTVQETHQVAAIDLPTQKIRWVAATGKQPAGIWLTPDHKHLLVGITGEDFVEVLSPLDGRSLQRIPTGKGAHNFLPMGDKRHVLLSNRVENTISVIDMEALKVVETIKVPGGPDDMELKKDGSELWVTSRWIGRVSVIDMKTRQVKHSIPVGRSPHGLYFHSHAPRL